MFTSGLVGNSKVSGGSSGGSSGSSGLSLDINDLILRITGEGSFGNSNNLIIDSSDTNATMVKTGNVTQGPISPFSPTGFSGFFDGSSDYMTAPNNAAFNFGTGDYTIEFWIFPLNWGSNGCGIVGHKTSDSTAGWVIYNNTTNGPGGKIVVRLTSNYDFVSTSPVENGKWQHWCLSRVGSTVRWFKNGKLDASSSNATHLNNITDATALLTIAHTQTWTGNSKFQGKISNIHIQKGIGISSEFTPSTSTPSVTAYTSYLGLCDNRFLDRSANNIQHTLYGFPDVADGPFDGVYDINVHGGSYWFPGSGSNIKIPDHPDLKFLDAAGNYSIEFWFKPLLKSTLQTLFYLNGDVNGYNEFEVRLDASNNLVVSRRNSAGALISATSAFTGWSQWNHLEISRNGVGYNVFLNGVLVSSQAGNANNTFIFKTSCIGAYNDSFQYFKGYISGLRILKGTTLHTSNFAVPTTPPDKITNTKLLLKATNANIVDLSAKNNILATGTITTTQSVVRKGLNSINFNGSGYLYTTPTGSNGGVVNKVSGLIAGSAVDFSAEAWIYMTVHSSTRAIISTALDTTASNSYFTIYVSASGEVRVRCSGTDVSTGVKVNLKEWTHLAIARVSNVGYLYVNGDFVYSYTFTGVLSNSYLSIGANNNASEGFVGVMDDIVLSSNVRFSSNITPKSQTIRNEYKNSTTNKDYQYEMLSIDVDNSFIKDITELSDNVYTLDKQLGNVAFSAMSPYSRGYKSLFLNGSYNVKFNSLNTFNYYGKKTTIEMWIFPTFISSANSYITSLLSNQDASGSPGQVGILLKSAASTRSFNIGVYGKIANTGTYNTAVGYLNQWNHIVVEIDCRTPSTTNEVIIYLNGVREVFSMDFSDMTAGAFPGVPLAIGGNGYFSNRFTGYMHDVRIVQSDTDYIYNGTITVPTTVSSVAPGTVFHLTTETNYLIDKGPNKHYILASTNVLSDVVMVPFSPFEVTSDYNKDVHGGSILLFAATDTSFVPLLKTSPNSSNFSWAPGTSDFTMEMSVSWPRLATGNERVLTLSCVDGNELIIGRTATNIRMYWRTLERGVAYQFTPGQWYHIAIVRLANNLTCYINGKSVLTYLENVNWSFNGFRIGMKSDTTEYSRAHISHIHLCQKALYSSEFIPSFDNVNKIPESKLLMKFSGGTFLDKTGNFTIIPSNTSATQVNTPNVGGMTAIQDVYPVNFNTGDNTSRLLIQGSRVWQPGNADWTIEFNYKKVIDTAALATVILRTSQQSSMYAGINIADAANALKFSISNNGTSWTVTDQFIMNITTGSTYNVVFRKTDMTLNVYVNGVYKTRLLLTGPLYYLATSYLMLGNLMAGATGCSGEISQFRLTTGRCKYQDNIIDV